MDKIKITIPDNLTKEQEVIAIAKQLSPKLLPEGKNLVSQGHEVKALNTTIEVIRKPVKRVELVRNCTVCKTDFTKGKKLFINYGGSTNERRYCSDECRDEVLKICRNRASKTRNGLKPARFF